MIDEQMHMRADLRYPTESRYPGDKDHWSQWRLLPLIEMSARESYHFVRTMISPSPQKILEIGCGNGYLSLELARDGHEVVGLDLSPETITLAEQTRDLSPPAAAHGGTLFYQCADFETWQADANTFDCIIMNRTLHHIHHLHPTLAKVKHLLTRRGKFICQDYAYDRLNEQTVSWMYSMQRLLFLSGLSREDPATTEDEKTSIQALSTAWFGRAAHRLNGYDDMRTAFGATFDEQYVSWFPYLFVYIANSIHHATAQQEYACIAFLKQMEEYLIEKELIQAVGFRYIGTCSK